MTFLHFRLGLLELIDNILKFANILQDDCRRILNYNAFVSFFFLKCFRVYYFIIFSFFVNDAWFDVVCPVARSRALDTVTFFIKTRAPEANVLFLYTINFDIKLDFACAVYTAYAIFLFTIFALCNIIIDSFFYPSNTLVNHHAVSYCINIGCILLHSFDLSLDFCHLLGQCHHLLLRIDSNIMH